MHTTHPIRFPDEIFRMKRVFCQEGEYLSIHPRPQRFHQVIDERPPTRLRDVQDAQGRVEPG